jgi:hypothetical protein
MCRHRFLWLASICLLSLPLSLSAQTTTGTVRGYVKDQNGAPVAAEIQARQTNTGVVRSATAHADGSYIIPGLAPGNYLLSVRQIGYGPQARNIVVQIGATLLADFALQAGALELQAVIVEAAPTIELRSSEVATNVTQQQIQQLPTASRNFLDLAVLAPGMSITEDRVNGTSRTFAGGGASPNQVNVFVDGSSLKNDVTAGGVAGQDASRGNPFPRSAIQEYRVISQNFKAEYQKSSSAIITATTRSGGARWAGNVLLGYQNKGLLALDTFQVADKNNNPTTFRKPDYSRVLTAVSLGGPLQSDKLFFFGSYEGNYQNRANRVAITPPTGFAALDTVNLSQFNGNFTSPFRENLIFGKLTYAIDSRSSAELSFNNRHETDVRDFGGTNAEQTAVNFRQNVSIAQFRYNRTMGSWLNEAKIDYSRFRRNPSPNDPGVSQRAFHYGSQNPAIGSNLSTQDFVQRRIGLRDDITYSGMQRHAFKGGASIDFVKYNIRKLNNETPLFEYADFINPACWCRDTAGEPFAFRSPYQLVYASGAGLVSVPNTQVGAYLEDDWTPTTRLTLNLGLRWDFESNMINRDYVTPQSVVDTLTRYNDSMPTPLDLSRYISTGSNRKPFYGAIQPRLGFSYALDDRNTTTIFGGWGIYYDRSIFDFSVDEIQKIERPTYIVRFAHPDSTPTGNEVPWNDSYLTADTSVISGLARSSGQPEAFLLDNKAKPPKSTQYSVGVRRVLGNFVAQLSYQAQRGTDLFTYNWQNFGLNATGGCCVSFNIGAHGFRNFIYSTNEGKTWYDAVAFQLDRPYRRAPGGSIGWGGGFAYTYAKRSISGVDNLGDITSSFPGAFPNTEGIPKHSDNGGNDVRHQVIMNWITDVPYLFGIQFSGLLALNSGARLDIGCPSRFCGPATYINGGFDPKGYSFLGIPGWAYRRLDLRLRKDFPRIGGTQLAMTLDVFNVFNYQNFGCYNTGFGTPNPDLGKASCVVSDPRRAQIGAEYSF